MVILLWAQWTCAWVFLIWWWISDITKQKGPYILYDDSRCWLNIYRVLYTYMSTYTYAHTHIWVHSPEMRSLSRLLALWRQEPVQAGITPPVSGSLQRVGGVMDWMLVSPQNPYVETLVPIWWYLKGRPLGGNQIMKDGALMNGALMNGISALIRRGQRAS